ncbi:MAG: SusD/RagB family nutrient-binding outer membrane lipoprotein, partial [Phaeodactylibacter sp.]|nr:SusD/RagB family nutrient-binding outer membrane lipoprotein [Phaeodactylibacter sp.]
TPNVLLPQIEVRLAFMIGGDASRYLGIYTQHVDGAGRQFAVIQNYGIQPSDVDAMWGQNSYSGILMDNRQLMADADANGYNYYSGISRAIEAYTVLFLTDMFGDIPYSEALQGLDNLQPAFDAQQSIYNELRRLISEARILLSGEEGPVSTDGDLIYGGNAAKWQKFLNVLEARLVLHLAKRDNANYQNALDILAEGGFESSADDARIVFGTTAASSGPWFQYIEQRDDINIGDSYQMMMEDLNDPRRSTHGHILDVTDDPHPIFKRDQAVPLLTFTEQKFIEAECQFQAAGAGAAHQAYLDGIQSSFVENQMYWGRLDSVQIGADMFAVADLDLSALYDDYVAQASVDPGSGALTINEIMTQKYIALFSDPEVFCDWRRTGIPTLDPNTGTQVPRRL